MQLTPLARPLGWARFTRQSATAYHNTASPNLQTSLSPQRSWRSSRRPHAHCLTCLLPPSFTLPTPASGAADRCTVGGVPTYLSWFRAELSLPENVRDGVLAPGSLALGEVLFLLYDELHEPWSYLAILEAIRNGHHTFKAIKDATLLGDGQLLSYLAMLQAMRYVERRLPVTIPPAKQRLSRLGRYHLSDPFFRFYFRFIHPHRDLIRYAPERILPALQSGLRAFVGQTAWEELARQWVREQGAAGALALLPEAVGSHWSRTVQVDVVAVNWKTHNLLLGECKWSTDAVSRDSVRELITQKTPRVLADMPGGAGAWTVHYALFTRAGLTDAAAQELAAHGGISVDLPQLYADLAEGMDEASR